MDPLRQTVTLAGYVMSEEYFGSKDERNETQTVESRKAARDQLQSQVEEFLAKGGQIEQVDPHVTADPPQKPSSSYSNQPI